MVFLTVKGTKHLDEFTYEADLKETFGVIAKNVARIQNSRLRIKNQLLSLFELLPSAEKAVTLFKEQTGDKFTDNKEKDETTEEKGDKAENNLIKDDNNNEKVVALSSSSSSSVSISPSSALKSLKELNDLLRVKIKDVRTPLSVKEYDDYFEKIRQYVMIIFPKECTNEKGIDAAIDNLYELHDNPDIDEDYRVFIYHCRVMMDPLWRFHEMLEIDESDDGNGNKIDDNSSNGNPENKGSGNNVKKKKPLRIWFNGKEMSPEDPVSKLCGNNNKSRIVVKVTSTFDAAAPSLEPKIDYNEQRDLRNMIITKREVCKNLEESELKSLVNKQARPKVILNPSSFNNIALPPGESVLPVLHTNPKMSTKDKYHETIIQGMD